MTRAWSVSRLAILSFAHRGIAIWLIRSIVIIVIIESLSIFTKASSKNILVIRVYILGIGYWIALSRNVEAIVICSWTRRHGFDFHEGLSSASSKVLSQ